MKLINEQEVLPKPTKEIFAWNKLTPGYVCLSPMCGVTDSAYRQIAKKHGAEVVFTEMASANMLLAAPHRSDVFLHYEEWERPIICQLMGGDPKIMAEAAKLVENLGFDGIDVNMGCPEKKIVGNACGSSLLNFPDVAARIVEAMTKATILPISVKMRSGFGVGTSVQPEFALKMEAAGAQALAIHPRTKEQGYHGFADWSITKQVVEAVKIPVGGSGDVTDREAIARLIEETGVTGIWVARGAMGNPWIFDRTRTQPPTLQEVVETVLEHARLIVELKGPHGIIELRKHLTWYFNGFPGAAALREAVKTVNTYDNIVNLVDQHLGLTYAA